MSSSPYTETIQHLAKEKAVSKVFVMSLPLVMLVIASAGAVEAAATKIPEQSSAATSAHKDREVYRVLNEFMQALRKGSVARAYQAYTSDEFRRITNLETFTGFIAQYPSLNRNRTAENLSIVYDKNVASVTVSVSSSELKDNLVVFSFVYEAGHWRIMSIKIYPPFNS